MQTATQVLAALLTLPLLTNCTNNTPTENAALSTLNGQPANSSQTSNDNEFIKDSEASEAFVQILSRKANSIWGDSLHASPMEYVKYTDHYITRVIINFEQGKIHIKTQKKQNLRNAIVSTLLTPYNPEHVELFSDRNIPFGEEPMLYGQVLDQHQKPIRWQWQAQPFADYLINNQLQERKNISGTVYTAELDLVKNHTLQRQYHYSGIIRLYGSRYNIDEGLIYAIIHTESNFNPYAISRANAYGLMQIIPSSAGKDVFKKMKKKAGLPSKDYLLQPHSNIDTGTAYLHLLKSHYLKDIEDPVTREYAMISAYNGGAGNMLSTFSRSKRRAIEKMNALTPEEVYEALTTDHPLAESRQYLEKVITAQKSFYEQFLVL